ncbi:MAG TPA: hypothetical protein PKD24_09110 [Pyrinomonadaceae bacterium]|nr:hypothetical protein [Pyrinomonadaceae bacterium]HMP65773.1 hypothetical protein [Pyrinomonadaceae bacterium]
MKISNTKRLTFMTLALILAAGAYPYESVIAPEWRVRVIDVEGTECQRMPVMERWGHYSLFLTGNTDSADAITDERGYVIFPERRMRASGVRRLIMPFITKALTMAHGSHGVHASVHVNGLTDVAWLSYRGELPLPETAKVQRCLTQEDLRPKESGTHP